MELTINGTTYLLILPFGIGKKKFNKGGWRAPICRNWGETIHFIIQEIRSTSY